MMIMKFNKMIRNKVVWWIIGSIVIFSFVGWFTPRGGCDKPKTAPAAGTLDGQPVTDNELREARNSIYVGYCLSVNEVIKITPKQERELRAQAWKRIAALRTARELGLTASPEEVLAQLKRDPQFQAEGGFSKQRYQLFQQNVLGALRTSVAQFEKQLAENIILQKLHNITASAVWMSQAELLQMASRYADSFRIEYVNLGTNLVPASEVKVTDADLHACYAKNTNSLTVPPKAAVNYIRIPIADYLTKVADSVDTNAIADFYDAHTDEYSTTDTNGVKIAMPLETVSGEISNKLVHAAASQLARDAANSIGDLMIPNRAGRAPTLEAIAAASNLVVVKTGLFDAGSEIQGIDAGRTFNTAAFLLRPTADECFSDAIVGSNYVYLMTLQTNTDAYIPSFEAVKDQVKPIATAEAMMSALTKKAQEIRQFFQSGLNQKQSFSSLALAKGLNVSTTEYFSAQTAPDAVSSQEILDDITLRNANELTDVLQGVNGLMIAHIVNRRAAGADELSTIQNQVAMNKMRQRARILFGELQNSLVAGKLKKDTGEVPETTEEEQE